MWWYYLDEVFTDLFRENFDHAEYPMFVAKDGERYNFVLAGPTCDSIDILYENISLPLLDIGDLIIFESMVPILA